MIESVKIQNFRCFSELEVSGLKPINIIVGENASGKSAFLESIFISSGAVPQVAFQLRAFRQLGNQIELQANIASYWSLWEDIFYQFDLEKTISIEIDGALNSSRSLRVRRTTETSQTVPFGTQVIPPPATPLLSFEWTRKGADTVIVVPRIKGTGLVFDGHSLDFFPTFFFGPHISDLPNENADRLSSLSKNGKLEPVVAAMKGEFPFIKNLLIEIYSGGPMVYAEVDGTSRKFPVALISDGVNKLLSILLAIANFPNGTVLIDQIEDGFYFKKMPSIWKVIRSFAKDNNTQIFATTHSQECLTALLPTLEANQEDFALLHASRAGDSARFTVANGRRFLSALSQEFELR